MPKAKWATTQAHLQRSISLGTTPTLKACNSRVDLCVTGKFMVKGRVGAGMIARFNSLTNFSHHRQAVSRSRTSNGCPLWVILCPFGRLSANVCFARDRTLIGHAKPGTAWALCLPIASDGTSGCPSRRQCPLRRDWRARHTAKESGRRNTAPARWRAKMLRRSRQR